MRTPEPVGQQGRWLDFLAEFYLNTVHHAGKNHSNCDALSRRPCERTSTEDCPQCVHGTTTTTAPQVRQRDESKLAISSPEPQSSSSGPVVAEDVVSENGHDESGPPLPPWQWADETVTVPEGATDYIPAWANMDNWIPVISPDDSNGNTSGNNGELSATATAFRPAQSLEGDTAVKLEILYTLPMQRVVQVSQLPKPLLTSVDDRNIGSSQQGTPDSTNQPVDSLLMATLAHLGRQMVVQHIQMASVQEAVSEMKCQCQWLTSQFAPQPYQFAGLVKHIACETNSVSDEDESGNALDETEQRDLVSDGMRQWTAGCRRRCRPRGQCVSTGVRDTQAFDMPERPAKFPSASIPQQPGYSACELMSRAQMHANTLRSSPSTHVN